MGSKHSRGETEEIFHLSFDILSFVIEIALIVLLTRAINGSEFQANDK